MRGPSVPPVGKDVRKPAARGASGVAAAAARPAISLPKGGGAIRGIGETFAATPAGGTGALTIPIPTSPGRDGFGPQLVLAYDSGAGNGPFGFGWNLAIPAVTRKTDKGLPHYADARESDAFLLTGAEELVPVLQSGGTRFEDTSGDGYTIHRYRPRVESHFARIERWTHTATGEIHWRSITRDNVTSLYGKDRESCIADPAEPEAAPATRIVTWLICESYDDKGNAIRYEYAAEDAEGVDRTRADERNRVRSANRYLKRIRYGNRVSRFTEPGLAAMTWLFEVVFDYDEAHCEALDPDPSRPEAEQHRLVRASPAPGRTWGVRPDPFSSHRSGFEVRTYRRCRRVLMFHRFAELGAEPCLVRTTAFDYADLDYTHPIAVDAERAHQGSSRFGSFVCAVTQSGYVRDASRPPVVVGSATYHTYLESSLPPLEFEYAKASIDAEVRELDAASLENLPAGVDGGAYQWVDLDGEGVSGILTEQGEAWFYKPNLGGGRFGALQPVSAIPSIAELGSGRQQLLDLAGDGQLDLASFAPPTPGFFERTPHGTWESFRPFRELPVIRWDEPNLQFVDLDGDGRADVLVTEHDVFTWHPSLGEDGFGEARHVRTPFDEEHGPRLVLADGTQSVYLADMCGDGLTDVVRIRNGEVCYWPNVGYGRFGAKVTMHGSPLFDRPEAFDQRSIRLADIDGSGTTDIIYLAAEGVRLYFNQCGNGWSEARPLPQFPAAEELSSVVAADVLGNGTTCLVWSSSKPADASRPLRYVDLMGGTKPHLLVASVNNLGAELYLRYASSTKFYLADKAAGTPWVTRVPFPVHVVERVETYDRIARSASVSLYAYRHGYFDGVEREFRGFGFVEEAHVEAGVAPGADLRDASNAELHAASDVPPIVTRTWFHSGAPVPIDRGEYYREPGLTEAEAEALLVDDVVLDAELAIGEEREAYRALKGAMLRQEVYARDGGDQAARPYTVVEQSFTVRRLQPQGSNRHAAFLVHAAETITYQYERALVPVVQNRIVDAATAATNPSVMWLAAPRISHELALQIDDFGNTIKSAAVAYGCRFADDRLPSDADRDIQTTTLVTYTESPVTNAVDEARDYRAPLPAESRTYELTGLAPGARRFTPAEILEAAATAATIDYSQEPAPGSLQKRLVEHVCTLHRANDLTGPLPLGTLHSRGLLYETYRLAFTPALVTAIFGGRVTDAMLAADGGYLHFEGDANWWIPSGRIFYSPDPADPPAQELAHALAHFFLAHRYREPFPASAVPPETIVSYDVYDLLVQETQDALGGRMTVGERHPDPVQPLVRTGHDYRVLQPALVMDANRNRVALAYDALGLVAGTAVMGKPEDTPARGDALTPAFRADLTRAEVDLFLQAPSTASAAPLLAEATTRIVHDVTCYWRQPDPLRKPPAVTATLARTTHLGDPVAPGGPHMHISAEYSDGFGREVQTKVQAEPGRVPRRDSTGALMLDADGQPELTLEDVAPRWIGSAWTVFNAKGLPVRRYEPFFSDTHRFDADARIGVSSALGYDPGGRVIVTLDPDHTWEKHVFGPWRTEAWDASDTVLVADPAHDADAGGVFRRLRSDEYLPTWHARRDQGALGAEEQAAARNAAVHAATPAVSYVDPLNRTVLTVAHNRFRYSDALPSDPAVETFHVTRTIVDVEGNERVVVDARHRIIMQYGYDMLGTRVHRASMEGGERWTLEGVADRPVYTWDSRDSRLRTAYDALQRPTDVFLREGTDAERLVRRSVYGDTLPNPEAGNLRGKVVTVFDQAGIVTTDEYDFKGNLLRTGRQLAQSYSTVLDWSSGVPLEPPTYTSQTAYDALNRRTEATTPDSSVVRMTYNAANQLEALHANVHGAQSNGEPTWTPIVTDIDYDAKGQRTFVRHGNGVETSCTYDTFTSHLVHVRTRRDPALFAGDDPQPAPPGWPGRDLQNLHYTYDPAGNVTHVRDEAQQTIYFRNQRVEPRREHTYDALYRLIESTGREHLGTAGGAAMPHSYNDRPRSAVDWASNDGNALGRYLERYVYDAVGNIESMRHIGAGPAHPGWTRTYTYGEPSLVEPAKQSNRLTSTTIGSATEVYSASGDGYDAHGNMLRMPHLAEMQWGFSDELRLTRRQAVNTGDVEEVQHAGERTWYVYDSEGQRVRKVTELAGGQVKDERIYLDDFEVYRTPGPNALVRETLHVMDGERRVALVESRIEGSEPGTPARLVRHQFGDLLGSVSLELDDAAEALSYEEYAPFGATVLLMLSAAVHTRRKRYRFIGKERDEENGFTYHGARYYAPWLGRWTRSDPAGIDDGPNTYAYSRSNPVTLFDPEGEDTKKLEPPKADIGRFTKEQLKQATITVFGEMGAKVHKNSQKEARAIASTIFNRERQIIAARAKHKDAVQKLTQAAKAMRKAAGRYEELTRKPTKYRKEFGAKEYERRVKEAKAALDKAKKAFQAADKRAGEARDERIRAESRVKKEKRQNAKITLTDIVEQHKEYEGTRTGKKLVKDFPGMSEADQERNLKRWEMARKAVEEIAKDPSKADKFNRFVSVTQKDDAPSTGTTKIGQNIFWRE